jgi:major membrane immunogen (membrane-anchored lipoprotein)
MRKILLMLISVIAILLSSCSIHDDPRSMATTQISLTYDGNQCQPYESFVPQGQEIEITIINESKFDITWYLIFKPIEGKFEEQDPKNILASASAVAGQISVSTFTAPNLPARYDSLCIRDSDSEKRALTFLLVVEPYED